MFTRKTLFFLVTFILVLLYCHNVYATNSSQIQFGGKYNLSDKDWQHKIKWNLWKNVTDQHLLKGQVVVENDRNSLFNIYFTDWIFEFENNRKKWALYYNTPHFISADFFRTLHKDYFSQDKLSFIYQQKPWNFLILVSEEVPIKDGIPSMMGYLRWGNQLKHIDWQISGLRYDSGYQWRKIPKTNNWDYMRNWGDIFVVESQVANDIHSISGACALMRHSLEEQATAALNKSRAFVINGNFFVHRFRFRPGFRYIGEDFAWPLTKNNRYAKDRVGYFGDLRYKHNPWQITYKFNALTNIAGTRNYPSSELLVEYKQKSHTYYITKKWQPTQRYTAGYSYKGFSVEWRSNGPQLKLAYSCLNHLIKFASSSFTQQRIEYRYTNNLLLFQYIYKIDHSTKRNFSHFMLKIGEEDRYLKIRYGENDGGQLAAKFDHIPSLYLGWCWRW